jgi:two-component system, LuxR family, response regulator DctR
MNNSASTPNIIIVDDDDELSSGIEFLLATKKWNCLKFSSGESFIAAIESDSGLINEPGVILLDVRMLGISGFDVFYWIQSNHPSSCKPIIFLTGHGELPQAVQMMKRGAFDFVQKPFDSKNLISLISSALSASKERFEAIVRDEGTFKLLKTLTEKEHVVMQHIFKGDSNKEIADLLGNSVRTVELHRASIFHKLQVKNAIEMARLLENIEK